jgi:uncharacterized protein
MNDVPESHAEVKWVACPCCGVKAAWNPQNKFRPFCSERCKLIDLGQWANERFRVAGEAVQEETASPPADRAN